MAVALRRRTRGSSRRKDSFLHLCFMVTRAALGGAGLRCVDIVTIDREFSLALTAGRTLLAPGQRCDLPMLGLVAQSIQDATHRGCELLAMPHWPRTPRRRTGAPARDDDRKRTHAPAAMMRPPQCVPCASVPP